LPRAFAAAMPERMRSYSSSRSKSAMPATAEALRRFRKPDHPFSTAPNGQSRDKTVAMVLGTNLAKAELGLPQAECRAAGPRFSLAAAQATYS